MKHIFYFIFLFLFFSLSIKGQNDAKRDNTWLFGYWSAKDSYSLTQMNFNKNPLDISPVMKQSIYIGFNEFNASICDEVGEILFYSNGCSLRNRNHNIVAGSEGINIKPSSPCFDDGLRMLQGGVIIPQPESKDTFLFFHKTAEIKEAGDHAYELDLTKIYAKDTIVKVIFKNKVILTDTVALCEMTTVRHANGKDWWLAQPKLNSNGYYIIPITKNGPQPEIEQSIGATAHEYEDWWSQCSFSPDGKHYVRARGYVTGDIHFFDFDRSSGVLSNPQNVNINPQRFDEARPGVAFSSNSRFMYISRDSFILQYDLDEPDFLHSADTVAHWETFYHKGFFPTRFGVMQSAPDCRIYIATAATTPYMQVILYPNRKGKACSVLQNKLKLPTVVAFGLPNYPHFRLGAEGEPYSTCDSTIGFPIPVSTHESSSIASLQTIVYPNPATQGTVNIDFFNMPEFTKGSWILYNLTGQSIQSFDLLPGHSEYNIDTDALPAGVYIYNVILDNRKAVTGRLVVE